MNNMYDPKDALENGYSEKDWCDVDLPEAKPDELKNAKPFASVFPSLATKMEEQIARKGQPPLDNPKIPVSLRLDADVLVNLKKSGKGWQTRVNAMLRNALEL